MFSLAVYSFSFLRVEALWAKSHPIVVLNSTSFFKEKTSMLSPSQTYSIKCLISHIVWSYSYPLTSTAAKNPNPD